MKKTSSVLSVLLALLMVLNVTAFAAGGEGGGENQLTLVSAKVGDADLSGSKIPAGSEITLTFSNNVTDESVLENNIGKIKVRTADDTEAQASVSPGADKTVFTVTLGSELAKGDYKLTVDKDFAAKNGSTLGTKQEISFSVKGEGSGEGGGENQLTLVSAKVVDADLSGSKIPAGSEITLTFSNNVTDESVLANNIGKIKVTTADGTAADSSVSPGTDKTVFTVTLGSELAKGDYKLTVGKDFAAKNGSTLGTKQEISFSVKGNGSGEGGGNNPLEVVSVKAGDSDLEGAELEASGKIVITFSRGMTDNQTANFGQIGIYDADGKKVEGVTFSDFTKNSDGNTYTELSYSELVGGSYTLKLGKNLKANNGKTLGEEKTYSFTVAGGEEPAEKTILDKIFDFVLSVIDYVRNLINKVLAFFNISI